MPALKTELRTFLSRMSRYLFKPPPHASDVLRLYFPVVRVENGSPRHEHYVRRYFGGRSLSTKDLPQQSLCPVSLDGSPDLPARDEAHPQAALAPRQDERYEVRAHPSPAFPIGPFEVRPLPQRLGPSAPVGEAFRQTARRCRPLRRRRASTARPALDRILTRKPWVRLRRRRFGWNVLFISS